MTTLKNYHAEDIAAAMAETLADEDFAKLYRKASMEKIALTLDEVRGALEQAPDPNAKWNQIEPQILEQENKQAGFYGQAKQILREVQSGGRGPGTRSIPILNDDGQAEDEAKKPCGCLANQACDHDASEADDAQLAVAMDFAIKHLNKIANALDTAGFPGVAQYIDTTSAHIAEQRPKVSTAAKKKGKDKGDGKPGRSYKEWLKALPAGKDKEAFEKRYKGAFESAKKKGMKMKEAEEYAARTAIDKLPKKYLKEPTGVHGPGKSGPKVKK